MVKDNSCGIAEIQDKMLDNLKCIIGICEEHQLTYWLAGGTCLGALRHKGFIPWDDDLDIYMPRTDYEKLWQLFDEGKKKISNKYILTRTTKEKNYHHRVMQLVDITTTFINTNSINEDNEHGIYIDIIPVEACPTGLARLSQIFNSIIFSVYNVQRKPEYNEGITYKIISAITSILLWFVKNPDKRSRIWSRAEKKMTRFSWEKANKIVCTTSKFHELMTPFPKEWFGVRMAEYEDIQASIPTEAEKYCEAMYGDFMKLPPKESQVVRHHTIKIDTNTPYTEYKGIYYCIPEKKQ